ncbi:MAG: class I SAM-dependent methyltransferase [Phototrophicaceae bacterium]
MQDLSEFFSGADYDAQYEHLYEAEIAYLSRIATEATLVGHHGTSKMMSSEMSISKPESHRIKKGQGAILDIGCGTGIVTIPLAENTGLITHGVDISPEMLVRAREKSQHLDTLNFHLGNALDFEIDTVFSLVLMTGNAFQAFLTEEHIVQLLNNIHKHLKQDGLLIFDTRLYEGYDLSLDDGFQLVDSYKDASNQDVKHFMQKTHFEQETGILHFDMKRDYADGKIRESHIELKFLPFETLLTLFEHAGLALVAKYSNWDLEPFEASGTNVVFKLRKR